MIDTCNENGTFVWAQRKWDRLSVLDVDHLARDGAFKLAAVSDNHYIDLEGLKQNTQKDEKGVVY